MYLFAKATPPPAFTNIQSAASPFASALSNLGRPVAESYGLHLHIKVSKILLNHGALPVPLRFKMAINFVFKIAYFGQTSKPLPESYTQPAA